MTLRHPGAEATEIEQSIGNGCCAPTTTTIILTIDVGRLVHSPENETTPPKQHTKKTHVGIVSLRTTAGHYPRNPDPVPYKDDCLLLPVTS